MNNDQTKNSATSIDRQVRIIAAGFSDYLTKPLNTPHLLKRMDETLHPGEPQT